MRMATVENLLRQRDQVVERADAAWQAEGSKGTSPAFLEATREAIDALERIAEDMRAGDAGGLERCRTLRRLAGLKARLAPAVGTETLLEAEWLYREAGRALAGNSDADESALLDYQLGHVLQQIDPRDIERLSEAQERVQCARRHFAAQDCPDLAECDQTLGLINRALSIARLAVEAERRGQQIGGLALELERGGDVTTVATKLAALEQSGASPDELVARAQAVFLGQPFEPKGDPRHTAVAGQPLPHGEEIKEALERRFQEEQASGALSPERIASLGDSIKLIGRVLGDEDDSIVHLTATGQEMRQFSDTQMDNAHYLSHRGLSRPPAGTRTAALVEMNWLLRRRLMQAMNRPWRGEYESREAQTLAARAADVDRRIYEADADVAASGAVEAESLRPLATAVRLFTARPHVMPAHPVWGAEVVAAGTQTLFHAGPAGSEAVLALACKRSGLQIPPRGSSDDHARLRWQQLQRSALAVFDLRTGTEGERADASYELGMALTLGKPVVVLASPERRLPFDIAVDPVDLAAAENADAALADAVDRASCWTFPEIAGSPWHATLDHVLATYAQETGDTYVDQTTKLLRSPDARNDSLIASSALDNLLHFEGDGRTRLIYPRWAPAYPSPGGLVRLFHVTPYQPEWAETVTELARATCRQAGAKYVRGDEVSQPDVVASIWAEIAVCTHVLADLTGLNANVALELGMAHTLGKPVLMIGQERTADELFPAISKLRLQPYSLGERLPALGTAIENFLAP